MIETTEKVEAAGVWCEECGSYSVGRHGLFCERQTLEEWKASAKQYHAAWLKNQERDREWMDRKMKMVIRFRDLATFWQGKFRIVAAENNALRGKVSNQRKAKS